MLGRRLKILNNEFLMTLISLLTVMMVWEFLVNLFEVPQWFLPAPTAIIAEMLESSAYLWQHTLVTLGEIAQGFILAFVFGISIGTLIAFFPLLEKTLYKLLVATQAMWNVRY